MSLSALNFFSKTSGLATRDYEDDDFEEVSKGRFLVGTEDVIDVNAGKGSLDGKPHPPKTILMLLMGLQGHTCTLQPSTSINVYTDTESIKSQNCFYTSEILLVKFNIAICYLVVVMSGGGS